MGTKRQALIAKMKCRATFSHHLMSWAFCALVHRYYDDGERDLTMMGRGMQSNRASQHSRFSDTVLQVTSQGGAVLEQGTVALSD
jgi:hypothetical protein